MLYLWLDRSHLLFLASFYCLIPVELNVQSDFYVQVLNLDKE